MGAHSALILLWARISRASRTPGGNLAAAKRRGAYVVTIDVRRTEAAAQSDETIPAAAGDGCRPGTRDDARDRLGEAP